MKLDRRYLSFGLVLLLQIRAIADAHGEKANISVRN
jgi:hypothetical protein